MPKVDYIQLPIPLKWASPLKDQRTGGPMKPVKPCYLNFFETHAHYIELFEQGKPNLLNTLFQCRGDLDKK
jgi:hypothetical protein